MIQNRLAVSKYEFQKQADRNHGNFIRIKKEIEKLLNDYNYLYSNQIYRWFDSKDKYAIRKVLNDMVRSKKVVYDSESGIIQNIVYYDSLEEKSLNAFWVMIALNNIQKDMGNNIYLHLPHSKENTCKKISFFITPSSRESQILVIKEGEEESANYEINSKDCRDKRYMPERFILIESTDQIPYIQIDNIVAYVLLMNDGKVKFVPKE